MRPGKLKIGGYVYPVKWVKGCVTPDGESVQGYIHYPTKTIQVDTGVGCSSEPAEILLHEGVHGVITDRCLDKLFASCEDEELFVSSFSKGLLAVLRENKRLGEYLSSPSRQNVAGRR